MIIRRGQCALLIFSMILLATSCSTDTPSESFVPPEGDDEIYLLRPRFNKPQARPLGRVMLSWNGVKYAEGYEIHMSATQSFDRILKKWTIKGYNLEQPVESGSVRWFRLRAFYRQTTSSWSTAVKVEEKNL